MGVASTTVAVHLEENLDIGILGKLGTKFPINFQSIDNFLNAAQRKNLRKNKTTTQQTCAFANIYQTKAIVSHAGTELVTLSPIVTIRQFIFVKMTTTTNF